MTEFDCYFAIGVISFVFIFGLKIGRNINNGRAVSWKKLEKDYKRYKVVCTDLCYNGVLDNNTCYTYILLIEAYGLFAEPFLVMMPFDLVNTLKPHDIIEVENGSLQINRGDYENIPT